jgi:hypothetical protein
MEVPGLRVVDLGSRVLRQVQAVVAVAEGDDTPTGDELVGQLDPPEIVAALIDEAADLGDPRLVEPGHADPAGVVSEVREVGVGSTAGGHLVDVHVPEPTANAGSAASAIQNWSISSSVLPLSSRE